jgi:hypothetical protein
VRKLALRRADELNSAFTRVHGPSKTDVYALKDALWRHPPIGTANGAYASPDPPC